MTYLSMPDMPVRIAISVRAAWAKAKATARGTKASAPVRSHRNSANSPSAANSVTVAAATHAAALSAPGIGTYGSHHFAISSSIGATCSSAVSITTLWLVRNPVFSQFRAIQAHSGASDAAEYAAETASRSFSETPRRSRIIPATATTTAGPAYLLRQASAENAAAHASDARPPSSRCLSAQYSASAHSGMN